MPIVRRQGDAQGEDHSEERHPAPFDWRQAAPRWAMVTVIAGLIFAFGFLWGRYVRVDDARIEAIAKYQNDSRWDLIAKHTGQIEALERADLRHDERLKEVERMADSIKIIRALAEAEAKRKDRGRGGYGL